jgi:hypothetical protein
MLPILDFCEQKEKSFARSSRAARTSLERQRADAGTVSTLREL